MKKLITLVVALVSGFVFSQDSKIGELENTVTSYKQVEEHYGKKHDAAYRLLAIDKYNHNAIFYLLRSFQETKNLDSIPLFYEKLMDRNPQDVEPYLIREKYYLTEKLNYTERIRNLKKALTIDSKHTEVNYQLGSVYYKLFTERSQSDIEKEKLIHYATQAIYYFTVSADQDDRFKELLKPSLIQLSNYLGNTSLKKKYEAYNYQSTYFPIIAFANLPEGWKTNYSINTISGIAKESFNYWGTERAIFSLQWYSKHLSALEEPVLKSTDTSKVYRFTYLRSFHHPIVIRLENNDDVISIHWKVSDGAGGYEPGQIITNESKVLTLEDWNTFEAKIMTIKFWNTPTIERDELIGYDGAQWILEGAVPGKYHVVDRWGGVEIGHVCEALIKLTGMEIQNLY